MGMRGVKFHDYCMLVVWWNCIGFSGMKKVGMAWEGCRGRDDGSEIS